jgi:Spy/CpxP family protein refolding chaperone
MWFERHVRRNTHENGGHSMKKQVFIALSLSVLALGSVAASAAHGGPGGKGLHSGAGLHERGDPVRMVQHLSDKLDLDQTQRQEIENVVSAAKPGMDALRERAEANRKAMHELDINDGNYDTRLNVLASEKGAIATEQVLLHGRLKSEIQAVLTPEQREELTGSAAQMRERFGKHGDGHSLN